MRLLVPLIICLSPAYAGAQQKPLKGVDVSLISETTGIQPGKPFSVGLKIHHHEKYHTYWKSPGVAGVPTEIVWHLPEGFTAGEIQWPFPEKTFMAKYPVHGYERDVMLLVDIQPPANLPFGTVNFKATATWMACAEGCYPGKVDLELALPVSAENKEDPSTAETFAKARKEMPRPLENWNVTVISAMDAPEIRFRLTPKSTGGAATPPDDLYFFSSDGQVSSDEPQRVEKESDGSLVVVAARSTYSPKGKKTLPGVLAASTPLSKEGPLAASIEPSFHQ